MATETQASAGELQRFRIERQLGAGAFGTVFVAWDEERGQRVALKRLERADPASLYRFKQEFRALCDLSHQNLVRFHEFLTWGDAWCLTMDWIDGHRFDHWVRAQLTDTDFTSGIETRSTRSNPISAPATEREPGPGFESVTMREAQSSRQRFDVERLRHALRGLFSGVFALHGAGILHRDLKPSNVLVQANGQVVILDFGLVATDVSGTHRSVDGSISGTPAYMSPEQALGKPLTVSSDYYAIGVMLYEIFTGQVPFAAPLPTMLESRAKHLPPALAVARGEVPPDLAELTMALLQPDPSARPSRRDVMKVLQIEGAPASFAEQLSPAITFVGRDSELKELERHFEHSRRGRTVIVEVRGPSGYGKTALVRQFTRRLARIPDVVTLQGRCFERESMPFKAFDSLIDSLGTYLRRLRPVEAATFLPRDTPALLRLFPSLGRLDFIASLPGRPPSNDAHELRRRAFAALREIFTRIADVHPLVLFIDDVQWGDADSASLLRHLLAAPEPPAMLLIAAARDDASHASAVFLQALAGFSGNEEPFMHTALTVGPLSLEQSTALARELLGTEMSNSAQAQQIAEESAGNPLFVAQLVKSVAQGQKNDGGVSLQHVVAERVAQLPEQARLVLELLACSERPVHDSILREASHTDLPTMVDCIDRLRDEQLVTATTSNDHLEYEVPHDRLRLAVRDGIDAAMVRAHHMALATAMELKKDADPEALAFHYGQAQSVERSLVWNERAADRAAAGLAFDRAVKLYRRALDQAGPHSRLLLLLKLAEALARAGRCAEAATAYLQASELSTDAKKAEWRRLSAIQLLRAGHIEDALQTFGPVLERAGLALPKTPQTALASLLYHRSRLKLRGLKFKERPIAEVPREDLERIDLCWSMGTGLSGIDIVRSAHYHTSLLIHSLDSGEPQRVVRALSMHAVLKSLEGTEGARRGYEVAERARQIAESTDSAGSHGWAIAARAAVAWGLCDYRHCVEYCDQAAQLLRESPEDNFREIGSLHVWFALHSLFLLGETKQFAERVPLCVAEAEARGDRYTQSTAQAYQMPLYWVLRDRPSEGRREAEAALEPWPRDAWYHQHWSHLRAMCLLDLYEGHGRRVVERAERAHDIMKRTMQLRLRTLRIEFGYLQARGLLAEAGELGPSRKHEKTITQHIGALEKEQSPLATVYAQALRAGYAVVSRSKDAKAQLTAAVSAFEDQSMPLHTAAAIHAKAQYTGGEEGRRQSSAALATLESYGVSNPSRFSAMLMPNPAGA